MKPPSATLFVRLLLLAGVLSVPIAPAYAVEKAGGGRASNSAAMVIGLSPASGQPGTRVTVTPAQDDGTFTPESKVIFLYSNPQHVDPHTPIAAEVLGSSQIRFTVPADAGCGRHLVHIVQGAGRNLTTSNRVTFAVTSPCIEIPQITGLGADSGSPGAVMTVNGANFRTTPGTGLMVKLRRLEPGPSRMADLGVANLTASRLDFTLPPPAAADTLCGAASVTVKDPAVRTESNAVRLRFVCPANRLNVLSWNIKLLPPKEVPGGCIDVKGSCNTLLRPNAILRSDVIFDHDVVVFQEAFSDSHRNDILRRLKRLYPNQTDVLAHGDGHLFESVQDGGVVILSRWPFCTRTPREAHHVFQTPDGKGLVCSGADCFAMKGVLYACVNKEGQNYHVFGTHLNEKGRAIHDEQLRQMKRFVDSLGIGSREPVIMAGDFNIQLGTDEQRQMLAALKANLPTLRRDHTDPRSTDVTTPGGSYLDYVLFSNAHLTPVQATNEARIARGGPEKGGHVSDHHPVVGRFVFP